VTVEVALDASPREVEVPAALAAALSGLDGLRPPIDPVRAQVRAAAIVTAATSSDDRTTVRA
jgi:hypothetical protein